MPIGFGMASPPTGHVGLPQVVRGHVASAHPEQRADVLDELVSSLERHTHELGDGLPRDVVLRGPEPTAHDQRVGATEEVAHRADHPGLVVTDLAVLERVDPDRGELLADPRAVGVDDLTEQQLRPDREHVRPHGSLPASGYPPPPFARASWLAPCASGYPPRAFARASWLAASRRRRDRRPTPTTRRPRSTARRRGAKRRRTSAGTAQRRRRGTGRSPSTSRAGAPGSSSPDEPRRCGMPR